MPHASRSAEFYDDYTADVGAHLFKINPEAAYQMFSEDGNSAKAELSLDFACLGCHKSRSRGWAAAQAGTIHK